MSSILRIEASRANGAKSRGPVTPEGKEASAANSVHSTGPRTPEGKAIASRNSLKHGLLSTSVVVPDECSESFTAAHDALCDELEPLTYLKGRFIEAMAAADWRRGRAWHMEMAQLTHAVRAQEAIADPIADRENTEIPSMHTALAFGHLSNNTNTLQTLHRYEVRLSREFLRHLHELQSYRQYRRNISKRSEPKAR